MMALLSSASLIIRLLVAAAMVIASLGALPAGAEDGPRVGPVHHVQDAAAHACCNPEPTAPDENCGLACAQAPCGWTVLPAVAGWPEPIDYRPVQWEPASILTDDTAPETATPPPRS